MYSLKTLPNGARLMLAPMKGTDTVTVLAMAGTGSKNETRKNNGISHFLEHMFFKGTKKRPTALALSSELDSLGGVYNAYTTKEYTGYWAKVDARKTLQAVDVISDMLGGSKFLQAEIDREKGVIIEELNMYRDNPMIFIEDLFENLLYGDQPAGWDIIGTKENIRSFSRRDFTDYVRTQYGSQNLVFCLAGNINDRMVGPVSRYLGAFVPSTPHLRLQTTEKQDEQTMKVFFKKTDQAHLSLGVRAYPSEHEHEFAAKILSVILGGSMSSRLFINLRERNGLAYYVRTNAEFYSDSGYVTTQAGVPVDKIEKSIGIILAEYQKMKMKPVGAVELKRAKDMMRGRLIIQMESSDNVANWYARQETLGEKVMTPQEYLKRIDRVNAKEIQAVSREIFSNNKLNMAIIGPYEKSEKFARLLTI